MQHSRRKFFGVFAAGAAAAPIAAKAAADELMAKSAGIGMLPSASGYGPASNCVQASGPYISHEQQMAKTLDYIKVFGVPDFADQEMRDRARRVEALDSDIACKRTWSMSVKIQTQRERNYQRQLEHGRRIVWHSEKRALLEKLLGFQWPW